MFPFVPTMFNRQLIVINGDSNPAQQYSLHSLHSGQESFNGLYMAFNGDKIYYMEMETPN